MDTKKLQIKEESNDERDEVLSHSAGNLFVSHFLTRTNAGH